jgi:hypothetical protein
LPVGKGQSAVTIAICIKINDGLVLASDSATTIMGQTPTGQVMALNVYNNANKVFNLRKTYPIGAITWGAGSIGQASISTILKDLRARFQGEVPKHRDWILDKGKYDIEAVAKKLKEFVFDDLYLKEFGQVPPQLQPALGFIIAGYSPNEGMADEFQIDIENGQCNGPRRLRDRKDLGITWGGQGEALNRLIVGRSLGLGPILAEVGVPQARVQQALDTIQQKLTLPLVLPAMPLQDAIDLADFLVDLTIKFSRFMPGAPTVGGPVEIAAISKHEGFRWVKRKYYFRSELNPEDRLPRIQGQP